MAQYLVVFPCSLVAGIIFYFLGGQFATAADESGTFLGFGFHAAGAVVGFMIVFVLSRIFLGPPNIETPFTVHLTLKGAPPFPREGRYVARCVVTHRQDAPRVLDDLTPQKASQGRRDSTFLKLDLHEIFSDDLIEGTIRELRLEGDVAQERQVWEVEPFRVHAPDRTAQSSRLKISTLARSQGKSPLRSRSESPTEQGATLLRGRESAKRERSTPVHAPSTGLPSLGVSNQARRPRSGGAKASQVLGSNPEAK